MEASKSRLAESCAMKDQFGVGVYSIYTIGVAFECFLRATRKEGLEFDDKHNLITKMKKIILILVKRKLQL